MRMGTGKGTNRAVGVAGDADVDVDLGVEDASAALGC